jgi:hypothetical protein
MLAAIVQVASAGPLSRPPMGPLQRRNVGAGGASPVTPASTPHPAVVRIIVKERDGESMGSGSLIDIRDSFGLVITNWHVIRDASGDITVVFPDGFKSAARIVKADRDWDLAALSIWRPPVKPLPIATVAPQPGDVLSIAGYGPGDYRHVAGRCTQYQAPSEKHPFEIVELSAEARQGDSGGPIFNDRGELAGVLFGSSDGTTSGSYAGRIQEFLGTLVGEGGDAKPLNDTPALAGHNKPPVAVPPLLNGGASEDSTNESAAAKSQANVVANKLPTNPGRKQPQFSDSVLEPIRRPGEELVSHDPTGDPKESHDEETYVADDPPEPREHVEKHQGFDFIALLGETPFDQAKSALAAVGVIAIVMRAMKLGGGG